MNYAPIQCPAGKNNPVTPLPSPPDCSAGRALQPTGDHINFKGPWKNASIMEMPVMVIDHDHIESLRAIQTPIPKAWSWRQSGGNQIENARNQGRCGSCWAFATTSVLGDRYALKYNTKAPYPSVAFTMSCGLPKGITPNQECECGGNSFIAGKFFEETGTKMESCWPFSLVSGNNYIPPPCMSSLPDDCCVSCCGKGQTQAPVRFKAAANSTRYIVSSSDGRTPEIEATTAAIQREIMTYGPVVASFQVPESFQDWWGSSSASGDIYVPDSPPSQGGHSVVLTGWGEKDGVRFWEMRNSWGNGGDNGYCKFAFSLDTPKQFWTQIDIPIFSGGSWQGGVVSFQAGEKQDYDFGKGNGKFVIPSWSYSGDAVATLKKNWHVVLLIILIIIIIALLFT